METLLDNIPEETPSSPSRLWIVLVALVVIGLIVVNAVVLWQRNQTNVLLNVPIESCAPVYLRNMDTASGTNSGLPTIGQPMSAESLAAATAPHKPSSGASSCSVAP